MFSFLRRTTVDVNLGDGTLLNPLKVFIVRYHQPTNEVNEDKETEKQATTSTGDTTQTDKQQPPVNDGSKGMTTATTTM
jgi:hypothetical protein